MASGGVKSEYKAIRRNAYAVLRWNPALDAGRFVCGRRQKSHARREGTLRAVYHAEGFTARPQVHEAGMGRETDWQGK
jgi:hypothetical protein